jgi:hypothetical protein
MHSKSIKSVGYPQFGKSDDPNLHNTYFLSMRKSYSLVGRASRINE